MVENRVVVPKAAGVHGHMRELAAFDGRSVSLDGAQKHVRVRWEWESRGVIQVVDAIGVRRKLWMGDRSHTALEPVRVASTR